MPSARTPPSWRTRLARELPSPRKARAGAAGAAALAVLIATGRPLTLIGLALLGLWLVHDRLLGALAGWGIAKTPKAFNWTIERILIRPHFPWLGLGSAAPAVSCTL